MNSHLIASPAEDAALISVRAAFKVEATYRGENALEIRYFLKLIIKLKARFKT